MALHPRLLLLRPRVLRPAGRVIDACRPRSPLACLTPPLRLATCKTCAHAAGRMLAACSCRCSSLTRCFPWRLGSLAGGRAAGVGCCALEPPLRPCCGTTCLMTSNGSNLTRRISVELAEHPAPTSGSTDASSIHALTFDQGSSSSAAFSLEISVLDGSPPISRANKSRQPK